MPRIEAAGCMTAFDAPAPKPRTRETGTVGSLCVAMAAAAANAEIGTDHSDMPAVHRTLEAACGTWFMLAAAADCLGESSSSRCLTWSDLRLGRFCKGLQRCS